MKFKFSNFGDTALMFALKTGIHILKKTMKFLLVVRVNLVFFFFFTVTLYSVSDFCLS